MSLFNWLFGSNQQQNQTTTSAPDPRLLNAAYRYLDRSEQAADRPYQAFPGQQVAGLTPEQLEAFQRTRGLVDAYNPQIDALKGTVGASTQMWPGADQAAYMNPYVEQVLGGARRDLVEERDKQATGLRAQAVSRGAFGGERGRLLEAENNRNFNNTLGDLEARIRGEAYNTGFQMFDRDRSSQLDALNRGSQGIAQLQGSDLRGIGALESAGQVQQQQAQNNINAAIGDFREQRDWQDQRLGVLGQSFGNISGSVGQTTTQTGTVPGASPLSQIGGLGIAGFGIGRSLGWLAKGGPVKRYASGGIVQLAEGGPASYLSGPFGSRYNLQTPGQRSAFEQYLRAYRDFPPDVLDAQRRATDPARAAAADYLLLEHEKNMPRPPRRAPAEPLPPVNAEYIMPQGPAAPNYPGGLEGTNQANMPMVPGGLVPPDEIGMQPPQQALPLPPEMPQEVPGPARPTRAPVAGRRSGAVAPPEQAPLVPPDEALMQPPAQPATAQGEENPDYDSNDFLIRLGLGMMASNKTGLFGAVGESGIDTLNEMRQVRNQGESKRLAKAENERREREMGLKEEEAKLLKPLTEARIEALKSNSEAALMRAATMAENASRTAENANVRAQAAQIAVETRMLALDLRERQQRSNPFYRSLENWTSERNKYMQATEKAMADSPQFLVMTPEQRQRELDSRLQNWDRMNPNPARIAVNEIRPEIRQRLRERLQQVTSREEREQLIKTFEDRYGVPHEFVLRFSQ